MHARAWCTPDKLSCLTSLLSSVSQDAHSAVNYAFPHCPTLDLSSPHAPSSLYNGLMVGIVVLLVLGIYASGNSRLPNDRYAVTCWQLAGRLRWHAVDVREISSKPASLLVQAAAGLPPISGGQR